MTLNLLSVSATPATALHTPDRLLEAMCAWLLHVQRRQQRARVSHAYAVAERLKECDRFLDVLSRLVPLLALDE